MRSRHRVRLSLCAARVVLQLPQSLCTLEGSTRACVLQSTPRDSRVPLSPRDNKTRPCHLQQRRILQQYVNRPQLPIPEHICGAAQDVLLISLRVDFEEEDRLGNKLIKPDDASTLDDPPPVLLAWSQRLCLVDDLSYAVCLLTAFALQ